MIKPDIVISWPRNADYPLWRQMIRDNRDRFNEVIIVFTETNQGDDFREFVKQAMFQDHVLFVQSPPVVRNEDWRNVAVNFGLMQSLHSEWIWFTEEDFFPMGTFFKEWEEKADNFDVLATFDASRMHPCNILIRRSTLYEKTRRNFGVVTDELDHFGMIQKQLQQAEGVKIYSMPNSCYYHMSGLSHNMRLIADGEEPNWEKEAMFFYLHDCLNVSVPLDPRFKLLAEEYLLKHKEDTINLW